MEKGKAIWKIMYDEIIQKMGNICRQHEIKNLVYESVKNPVLQSFWLTNDPEIMKEMININVQIIHDPNTPEQTKTFSAHLNT